jgi:cell division protein ZapA (FtsZ GTPase activity inhibitor)
MDLKQSVFNYDILGYKIKLSAETDQSKVRANEIVDMVLEHTERIKKECPHLERGEIAVLAALTIAKNHLALSGEYKDNIAELEMTAHTALNLIEEVSPSTI